jgi:FkbM family methyltransferase
MRKESGGCDRNLVVDVGMNDGSDTAYYLHCGYKVVAVEANPILSAQAEERFRRELAEGSLTLLNIGIARYEGENDFWVSESNHQWSSFSKPVATRRGASVLPEPMRVKCFPLSTVIEDYGIPFYLKMDIEGHDLIGLESLSEDHIPLYISVEFAHGLETKLLERLVSLGYNRFKLINQLTFTDKMPIFDHEGGLRVLRKVYRHALPIRPLVRAIVKRSDFDLSRSVQNWEFPEGSSGPFAEQTYGHWTTAAKIRDKYNTLRRAYEKAGVVFWWDLHATI